MAGPRAPIAAPAHDTSTAGSWQIVASIPGKVQVNISTFRGAPTTVGGFSFTDPFGPRDMNITLDEVSYFDARGQGDLVWAVKEANITLRWIGELPGSYPFGKRMANGLIVPEFVWEGYIESFEWDDGMTIQVKGAMHQLDNHLAKPEYPSRPMTYEHAIVRQFRNKPSLRLQPIRLEWPNNWERRYRPPRKKAPAWEIPTGVAMGDRWTGLLTRSTGQWDRALTGYVQSLLTSMYTHYGRWTLDLAPNRRPVLLHRANPMIGQPMVVIDPLQPGVKISMSEDNSQSMTTLYGQGTSLSGVSYTGMNVSASGAVTTYEPLASTRQTWPAEPGNDWLDKSTMAREVVMETQQGLDLSQAQAVARNHLSRFADPGVTGTITLESDPTIDGQPILRHLVRAGMDIQIPGIFGNPEGLVARISESTSNFDADSVTLTFDTRFRDALTVSEVRERGRDSLQIPRMLVAGNYSPPVPDQLYPWSYSQGSGYVPSNELHSSQRLFRGMPSTVRFPWTSWTTQRPPSDRKWSSCYVRIRAAGNNANDQWARQSSPWGSRVAIPIRMSQAATIRLVQIAAYRADGTVYPVPFHVSLYYYGSTNYRSMPVIPSASPLMSPPRNYGASGKTQHHPFVPNGWEQYNPDGTQTDPRVLQPQVSAGLVRVWGTNYEKAGYWPGSMQGGGNPTGLLVDENQWSYDLRGAGDAVFNPYVAEKNLSNSHSGNLYMMIFCEDNTEPVYFMGRIFRVEPGGER